MQILPEERSPTLGPRVRAMAARVGHGCRPTIGATFMCAVLWLVGCVNDPVAIACTEEARASVMVTVLDSLSGTGLAPGTTVVLQDGEYRDSSVSGSGYPLPGDSIVYSTTTFERAGTYTVRVRRPGYALWERQGVQVTMGECHVVTALVRARLKLSS